MIKFYKYIWCLPSLILHEVSHILVAVLLLGKVNKIKIKRLDCVRLSISNLNSDFKVKLVAFSPVLVPLIFILLSFKDFDFIWGLSYSLSTIRTTLPSLVDFHTAKVKVPNFINFLYEKSDNEVFDNEVFEKNDNENIFEKNC
jgi:hypothetical protein